MRVNFTAIYGGIGAIDLRATKRPLYANSVEIMSLYLSGHVGVSVVHGYGGSGLGASSAVVPHRLQHLHAHDTLGLRLLHRVLGEVTMVTVVKFSGVIKFSVVI